jgi:hypothetical protein
VKSPESVSRPGEAAAGGVDEVRAELDGGGVSEAREGPALPADGLLVIAREKGGVLESVAGQSAADRPGAAQGLPERVRI